MGGCLRLGVPIIILMALAVYCAFPHPTHSETKLRAVAAESRRLMAAYPVTPSDIPKSKWPPAIASLKPFSVTVHREMVDITTKPFFDGGWGYGFPPDKQDLTMLVECWSALGHGVYWHGPC